MASRSCFAMKGLQASESSWKHPSEAKTPYLEDQSTHHSALWEFLKDKNIWRVENIDTQEFNKAGYVLDYRINQRLSVCTVWYLLRIFWL